VVSVGFLLPHGYHQYVISNLQAFPCLILGVVPLEVAVHPLCKLDLFPPSDHSRPAVLLTIDDGSRHWLWILLWCLQWYSQYLYFVWELGMHPYEDVWMGIIL